MKVHLYMLPCLLFTSHSLSMKINSTEIKDNFLTIKEDFYNKGAIFIAHTLHLQKKFHNENQVKTETLEIGKEFTGSGICKAKNIKLLENCTKFESGFLQTQELHITNPATKILLSASGAYIGALYKNDVYIGKIDCLFGASMYGYLFVTDCRPQNPIEYHFWGLWYDMNTILSDGVSKAKSVESLVAYLQKHL